MGSISQEAGENPHLFIVKEGPTDELARTRADVPEKARVRIEVVGDMFTLCM